MPDEKKSGFSGVSDEKEMGFLDHLEELRWRIIKILIGVILGSAVCGIFSDWIMDNVLLAPALHTNPPLVLINLKPYGQVVVYMQVILVCGAVVSIPNIFYQFWKFIEPGLLPKERKFIWWIVFFSSFCFLGGIAFAYFLMLPTALSFFAGFGTGAIINNVAIDQYFSFLISVLIASGVIFELPMVSYFLSKLGILKPSFMRKYRRHAIVLFLIIAAILAPSPDVTSQLMLGIPLIILFEISILISKFSQPKEPKYE